VVPNGALRQREEGRDVGNGGSFDARLEDVPLALRERIAITMVGT
jgi:hypothetical protein